MDLKYIGPYLGGVVVPLASGDVHVEQGGTGTFPDDVAASLLEQEENWQPADDAQLQQLLSNSRAELNELAAAAGVDAPESLPNKTAVAEAIIAAGTSKE